MSRPLKLLALMGLLAALALPALTGTATAAPDAASKQIFTQCQSTGQLSGSFTLQQLQHALATMSPELKEYTNCPDVVQAAITSVRSGRKVNGSGNSSGGSFLPTPVIVILVIVILAALTFGALAIRRRRGGPGGPGSAGGSEPADDPGGDGPAA